MLKGSSMLSTDASRTATPTQNRTSAAYDASELKIIQEAVGHRCDTSTAIYTHVSGDFMNTALRKALGPAFDDHASQRRKES
jgi:site-specific recombinase XerC